VKVRHQGKLERLGLLDLISSDLIYESRKECLAAYEAYLRETNNPAISKT